jgi:hypothetical protein
MPDEDIGHGVGIVIAPDWEPTEECGNGLHAWLHGEGDPSIASCADVDDSEAKWLCIEIDGPHIDLGGKVKFGRGIVRFVGTRHEATQDFLRQRQNGPACNWIVFKGGHDSALTGGYRSTLTGGHDSTLTGGDHSTLTGGHDSTLTGS